MKTKVAAALAALNAAGLAMSKEEQQHLWAIISALRGPDDENPSVKMNFTVPIRRMAGLADAFSKTGVEIEADLTIAELKDRFRSAFAEVREALDSGDNGTLRRIAGGEHLAVHLQRAKWALEAKDDVPRHAPDPDPAYRNNSFWGVRGGRIRWFESAAAAGNPSNTGQEPAAEWVSRPNAGERFELWAYLLANPTVQ